MTPQKTLIDIILSVDAISLDPFLDVYKNGTGKRVMKEHLLAQDQLQNLKNSIKEQENVIRALRSITIN